MMPHGKPLDQVLGIGALLLLAVGCALTLRPFLSTLLWAAAYASPHGLFTVGASGRLAAAGGWQPP